MLGANVENLTLIGIADLAGFGNALVNTITGNSGNNTLDGLGGADNMSGAGGNDTYYVDDGFDQALEGVGAGTDTVRTLVTYVLSANVENLTMQGTASIGGYGNALPNAIFGNSGDNTLDGMGGADGMVGGLGNDVYFVDNNFDVVAENPGEGTMDSVYASQTYVLGANVEFLYLTDTSAIAGFGNSVANVVQGNSGNNVLNGRQGADTLAGNAGNDVFQFNVGEGNGDIVFDFAGNGAAAGDSLQFVNYGVGATFTNIDATHWQINYNGGASHDVITFTGGPMIDPTDFAFVTI
jgi:Ca2+-binding RTX toxin-like protein